MSSTSMKTLAAGACLFAGILAGVTSNRALVELPAWERIGATGWADFTRAENHGIGAVFYLIIGFLALVLTLATALAFGLDRSSRRFLRFPAYASALLAIAYATITRAVLVPAAFRLRAAGSNVDALQQIFHRVEQWWGINDLLHVIAFGLSLWAFAEIASGSKQGTLTTGANSAHD